MQAFIFSVFLSTVGTEIKSAPYLPTYVPIQTGAFAGAISGGAGWEIGNYSPELLLGNTPQRLGGEEIYSLTWKNNFKVFTQKNLKPYVGLGLVMNLNDKDTFYVLPSQYPSKYYPATAFYTMPYVGAEYIKDNIGVYFEIATLDYYLEAKGKNWDYLTWDKVSTYGVGMRYYFK